MYSRTYTENSGDGGGLPKNYSGYAKAPNAERVTQNVEEVPENEVTSTAAVQGSPCRECERREKQRRDDRLLPLLVLMLANDESSDDGRGDELLLFAALLMSGFFQM